MDTTTIENETAKVNEDTTIEDTKNTGVVGGVSFQEAADKLGMVYQDIVNLHRFGIIRAVPFRDGKVGRPKNYIPEDEMRKLEQLRVNQPTWLTNRRKGE